MEDNIEVVINPENKPWFFTTLGGLEYSTDYKFFRANQIWISRSQGIYSFNSNLEAKCFATRQGVGHKLELSDPELELECAMIHRRLLNGEYGSGKFID